MTVLMETFTKRIIFQLRDENFSPVSRAEISSWDEILSRS